MYRWLRLAACSALALALRSAPATVQQVAAKAPPHCYDIRFGPWTPPGGSMRLYEPLPARLALTDQIASAGQGYTQFVLLRWPADPNAWGATWRPLQPDSVLVTLAAWWSTGIELRFPVSSDTFVGTAEVYADVIPRDRIYAVIRGRRVQCPELPRSGKRGA